MDINAVTHDIIGEAVKIHSTLGPGLLESAYETILAARLRAIGHKVECQKDISFIYEGISFDKAFRLDLLVDDEVIVELKSTEKDNPVYWKQLKTYLVLTGKQLGLLVNFGRNTLLEGVKRVVNNYHDIPSASASLREQTARTGGVEGPHAEPQRPQRRLDDIGKPVSKVSMLLPSLSAASAPLRENSVRTSGVDSPHAEAQSSQSCLDTGKPVTEAAALLPTPSADSAPLRENSVRTGGVEEGHAEPQSRRVRRVV